MENGREQALIIIFVIIPRRKLPSVSVEGPMEKRAGATSGGRGNRPDRGNSHFVLTFFGFFLIYDYCVSVTNIAGVCKSIHRELGGRLGLEKPQKRERGVCSGWWLTSPCESVHVTS